MSKPLTASVTPLRSAAPVPEKPRRAQCDRDDFGELSRAVKLHISEALYDDLARVAGADQRPVSETIRVLLKRHRYGAARAGD